MTTLLVRVDDRLIQFLLIAKKFLYWMISASGVFLFLFSQYHEFPLRISFP